MGLTRRCRAKDAKVLRVTADEPNDKAKVSLEEVGKLQHCRFFFGGDVGDVGDVYIYIYIYIHIYIYYIYIYIYMCVIFFFGGVAAGGRK